MKKRIRAGSVTVNGERVKQPEIKVFPGKDRICLEGALMETPEEHVLYLLNKPAGYVSATEDGRYPTVLELIPSTRKGLFPVGRLDKDTEGLLLITDDGDFAHSLLSPSRHVDKTYFARVSGEVIGADIKKVSEGFSIGEKKPTLPGKLEILRVYEEDGILLSEIRLTIHEGKYHQVKRMMEALGKPVLYLKRLSMGPFTLPDDLPPGACIKLDTFIRP